MESAKTKSAARTAFWIVQRKAQLLHFVAPPQRRSKQAPRGAKECGAHGDYGNDRRVLEFAQQFKMLIRAAERQHCGTAGRCLGTSGSISPMAYCPATANAPMARPG